MLVLTPSPFEDCNLQRLHVCLDGLTDQTSRDVPEAPEFSFAHLLQFVRLSMSFVVELAGWVDA